MDRFSSPISKPRQQNVPVSKVSKAEALVVVIFFELQGVQLLRHEVCLLKLPPVAVLRGLNFVLAFFDCVQEVCCDDCSSLVELEALLSDLLPYLLPALIDQNQAL